ncbi:hypothetical protein [Ensifer canadensis]
MPRHGDDLAFETCRPSKSMHNRAHQPFTGHLALKGIDDEGCRRSP